MAGEVVYADLNIPGASSSSRPPQGSPHLRPPPCPRWHRIAVGAGWAGNVVLTVAVIALGVWVSQLRGSGEGQTGGARNTPENSETGISSTECSSCLEDFRSRLKPILCEPHSFPGGAGCKLCPRDWLLRGDKCYWLSKGSKNWAGSRDDCLGKSSRLLVLQSQEELVPTIIFTWVMRRKAWKQLQGHSAENSSHKPPPLQILSLPHLDSGCPCSPTRPGARSPASLP
ncbi:killer cell lectin-like receptor subfamily B member 1B allele A isoform X2 [Pelodiscus sinensis]|uniref:killer cell lectin-like receptor subfamily B member 1B allele A isoform X2 n=1 Tax=Pelodiscus sinensis TaxID=13735 RepID=UPI003F6BFFE5